MADNDLRRMMQTTLNLMTILSGHEEHSASDVMGGLMRFAKQLEDAQTELKNALRTDGTPDALLEIMMRPNALAMRFGADDLIAINRHASESFAPMLGNENADLSARARADVSVWLAVTQQTLIAVKLLFQTARLYGRAPNGKRLENEG